MSLPMGRTIRYEAGYDARAKSEPGKTYGVHGGTWKFYYRGNAGVVQFALFTDWVPWQPRPVAEGSIGPRYKNRNTATAKLYPMAADLGYHSPVPHYEGQGARDDCHAIDGPCYYDGGPLYAEPLLVTLIYDGEEALWKELEAYYASVFGEEGK